MPLFGASQPSEPVYYHLEGLTVKEKSNFQTESAGKKQAALDLFRLRGYSGVHLTDSVVKKNGTHLYFQSEHRFRYIEEICTNCPKAKPVYEKGFIDLSRSLQKQIEVLSNNGYPFASIRIENETERGDTLGFTYRIDSSDYVLFDKITLRSEDKIHKKTLLNLINLKVGTDYSEAKLREIKRLIDNSDFFELKQPPQVLFRKGTAEIFLFVSRKKSNNADGFIGFNQDPDSRKLVFNGNIDLSLKNTLNRCEIFEVNWKSNPDHTQNLNSRLVYPWIFGLPLGVSSKLNLRKQDTTFIKSDIWFEAMYLNPVFTVSIFDQIEGSATIAKTIPPGVRDYKKNTVGLRLHVKPVLPVLETFYRPEFGFTAGIYKYRSDTISDNKQKIENNKYALSYGHTLQFNRIFFLRNKLEFQGLRSEISMSDNELIYYGGLRSVRGFYELELFGNNVWIVNSEFEWRPVNVLSFSLIYDYSIADAKIGKNFTNSVGLGLGLVSKNSRLEIVVANGILNHNAVDFGSSRIHIGFRSNF